MTDGARPATSPSAATRCIAASLPDSTARCMSDSPLASRQRGPTCVPCHAAQTHVTSTRHEYGDTHQARVCHTPGGTQGSAARHAQHAARDTRHARAHTHLCPRQPHALQLRRQQPGRGHPAEMRGHTSHVTCHAAVGLTRPPQCSRTAPARLIHAAAQQRSTVNELLLLVHGYCADGKAGVGWRPLRFARPLPSPAPLQRLLEQCQPQALQQQPRRAVSPRAPQLAARIQQPALCCLKPRGQQQRRI
jgi:hypothetical protein